MTEFKHWVALRATLSLMVCIAALTAQAMRTEAAVVRELRIGNNDGYVRMVLEFDRPLHPPPSIAIDSNRLQVVLTGIDNAFPRPNDGVRQDGLVRLEISRTSERTAIEAVFAYRPSDVKTFALTGPHRFIIDAYRPPPSQDAVPPVFPPDREPAAAMIRPPSASYPPAEKPVSASISGAIVGASLSGYGAMASEGLGIDHSSPDRFQQWLIAALIVVTTIIVILLFFLIWIGSGRGLRRQSAWLDLLPPTDDRHIEVIDSAIRERLKTYEHT